MKNLIYLILIVLLAACKDYKDALVFENEELNGTTYLKDEWLETNAVIFPKPDVYLYDGDTTKNYLQKVSGDGNGRFRFTFQPKEKDGIWVISEYRDSASLRYRAVTRTAEFADSLILRAQYEKGVIKVRTRDADGKPSPGVTVYLFTNKKLAEKAIASTPTGAIGSMKSNAKALAVFHRLDPHLYYIIGKRDSANVTKVDSVIISGARIGNAMVYKAEKGGIAIDRTNALNVNFYNPSILYSVFVQSTDNQPIAGIDVYIFSSIAQANSVKTEATGYVMKQKTGSTGKADFRQLPTGTFYLAANGKFMGTDSLVIKSVVSPKAVTFPTARTTPDTLVINTSN